MQNVRRMWNFRLVSFLCIFFMWMNSMKIFFRVRSRLEAHKSLHRFDISNFILLFFISVSIHVVAILSYLIEKKKTSQKSPRVKSTSSNFGSIFFLSFYFKSPIRLIFNYSTRNFKLLGTSPMLWEFLHSFWFTIEAFFDDTHDSARDHRSRSECVDSVVATLDSSKLKADLKMKSQDQLAVNEK